jgi:predicted DsbA family dithiol-disulfide isomerase
VIEAFADVWCPFAYVGLQLTRTERDLHAPATPIRIRAWPLELVNGAPMDVAKTAGNVADLRAQLGLTTFAGFDAAHFPTTTLPALALIAAAYATGDGPGERAAFRVREALFERGADISDPAVLDAIARELGVSVVDADRQTVLDDWSEGAGRGVQGSPHFFCGGRDVFCPSLSLSRDDHGQLHVVPDPAKLQSLDGCWDASTNT